MALISVSLLGVNPMALFTALTGIFLPLSFLFSSAASKYFEGLLLVLVRQPYDIGDRIALSNPTDDTNADGSVTWFVEVRKCVCDDKKPYHLICSHFFPMLSRYHSTSLSSRQL